MSTRRLRRVNASRVAAAAAGVLALAGGIALGGAPAGTLVEALVETLGNDYLLITVLAAVGLAASVPVVLSGRTSALSQATTPTPEHPATAPEPGTRVDEALASPSVWLPVVGQRRREALRSRLRRDAIETLVRVEACTRREASARVESGTWTEDPDAAALLAGDAPETAVRLRAILGGEPWTRRAVRRTMAELVDRGGDVNGGDGA
ncbi:MAG: DUF7269 family protein [Halobacteriota archaeon]